MSTEDLIRRLAQSPAQRPHFVWTFAIASVLGLGVASGVFLASTGARPDLFAAWAPTLLKISFGLIAALALGPLIWRAARPNIRMLETLVPSAIVVAAAALITVAGLIDAPSELRWVLWTGGGAPDCLVRIPLIALPIAAALFVAARRFAPTRLAVAGAALGAGAGALAAIPYSLFCPIDSAPYVATWYTVAVLICGALGAIASRLLRW